VLIIYAGTRGFLDKYPVEVLSKYETGLYSFIETKYPQILAEISEKKVISDELDKLMQKALSQYDEEFKDTIR